MNMTTAPLELRSQKMAPEWRRPLRQAWEDNKDEEEDEEEEEEEEGEGDDDDDDDDEKEGDDKYDDDKNEKDDNYQEPKETDKINQNTDPTHERLELSQGPPNLMPVTLTKEIWSSQSPYTSEIQPQSSMSTPVAESQSPPEKVPEPFPQTATDNSLVTPSSAHQLKSSLSLAIPTPTVCSNSTSSVGSKDMPAGTGLAPPPPPSSSPALPPQEPRKEINADSNSHSLVLATQTVLVAQTEMLGPGQATSLPIAPSLHHEDSGGLSTTSEHILVALGSIGAFIILLSVICFYFAMRGKNGLHVLHGRQQKKGGNREWLGLHREEDSEYNKPPPQYSQGLMGIPYQARIADEKVDFVRYPTQASEYPQSYIPPMVQKEDNRLSKDTTFSNTPVPRQLNASVNQNTYNNSPQIESYAQQPPGYNSVGNPNTLYSLSDYNTSETLETYGTHQTSNIYNTTQVEANRLSTLSSLSSGFGDGLQIPESVIAGVGTGVAKQQNFLPPQDDQARFSWVPSQPRDTIYSSVSIETAPRFRTVNSWVANQSSRIERPIPRNEDIPPMPSMPQPFRTLD